MPPVTPSTTRFAVRGQWCIRLFGRYGPACAAKFTLRPVNTRPRSLRTRASARAPAGPRRRGAHRCRAARGHAAHRRRGPSRARPRPRPRGALRRDRAAAGGRTRRRLRRRAGSGPRAPRSSRRPSSSCGGRCWRRRPGATRSHRRTRCATICGSPCRRFRTRRSWCCSSTARTACIAARELFRGTLTQTSVYPREIVKAALAHNAAAVMLRAQPSERRGRAVARRRAPDLRVEAGAGAGRHSRARPLPFRSPRTRNQTGTSRPFTVVTSVAHHQVSSRRSRPPARLDSIPIAPPPVERVSTCDF